MGLTEQSRVKTEKHADGLWHIVETAGHVFCGREREPQRRGHPGAPTCEACIEAAVAAITAQGAIDPPVRADGRCATCGKPRRPERSRKYGGLEAERDPFCSTACCRRWHGLDLTPDDELEEAAA